MTKKDTDETTILNGRVKLVQPLRGLRAGLDAVLVAAAVPAQAGDLVIDLGCASGAVGFCVKARVPEISLTGFDIQPELIACARESALLNHFSCDFICGDVRDKTALPSDGFDHVVCNPPYMQEGAWSESENPLRQKQMGHAAGDAGLQEWVDCMQRIVKPLGSVSLIHRADHLDKVLQAFGSRFGGIEIWPFYSKAGEAANRIVIRALKNRKSPTVLHPPVIVHGDDGGFTPEADVLLRDAKALK